MSEDIPSRNNLRDLLSPASLATDIRLDAIAQKLSVNQVTSYHWSLMDDVEQFPKSGINAIGLWRSKVEDFGEERAYELLGESNLEVTSLSWAGGFTGSTGFTFREAIQDTRRAIIMAHSCGSKCLHIASGARHGHTTNHARRLITDALRELGDFAGEFDVVLAVQPMHDMFAQRWTFLHDVPATLDVLNACDHSQVRMAFGTFHLWQQPRLLEMLPQLVEHIATVQLSDCHGCPQSPYQRTMLGAGRIPLKPILKTLLQNGYSGAFELDLWSAELWRSGDYQSILREARHSFQRLCVL